jgi:hypothetical protein
VTVNIKIVHENESIYILMGAVHRLKNPGKIPLELIEVQTGSCLGEDDINRIEDDYQRSQLDNPQIWFDESWAIIAFRERGRAYFPRRRGSFTSEDGRLLRLRFHQ